MNAKELLDWWARARRSKDEFHNHYDDLARVMLPRRLGFNTTQVDGERRTEHIYDGTPMQGARSLANGIGGFMRPEGIPRLEIQMEEDHLNNLPQVKDWLADSTDKLRNALTNPHANYLQTVGEVDVDLVVFGTAVGFAGESRKRDNLLFKSIHLRDATPYWDEEGRAVGMFRIRRLTLRQAVSMFGQDKLSSTLQQKLRSSGVNMEEKIRFLHIVVPREDSQPNALFARNLPFAEHWVEIDEKHLVDEGGFHEYPFFVPRWDTTSGEDLGRSPGMIALPDSETLQAMGETILIAGQRAADPPLAAPNDGSFDAVNTFPGGISYYDMDTAVALRGSPFFTIGNETNLPIARDMQLDTRGQIMNAFFKNVLNLPIDGPEMTATEVIQRKEEFLREMGPLFGRFDTEYNAPKIERSFMLLLRGGKFLPVPQELSEQNIVFIFDSPTKRVQKQVEAAAARMWVTEMIELSQVDPKAKDLVNIEEYGRFSAEASGVPHKIINDKDTVKAIQDARDQAILEQQQQEQLAAGAQMAKTGAEAAKNAGLVQEPVNP